MKDKIITVLGWLIQVWSVLSLIAIAYVLLFVPIPDNSDPFTRATEFDQFVMGLSPYDGLFWIGAFFLGRWMVKRSKRWEMHNQSLEE